MADERSPLRRWSGRLVWALLGAVAAALTVYILHARSQPDLAPWHREATARAVVAELDALEDASFVQYRAHEVEIFEALEAELRRVGLRGTANRFSRYAVDGAVNPANFDHDWNQSFEHAPPEPRGGVLLVHGLSDSPYSMRAIAGAFEQSGYHVLGLRMPGHGTIPAALRVTRWQDFRSAYRIGVRHLAERIGEDRPLVLVGYSNGAALAVEYALQAVDEGLRVPDMVVLVSPALRAPAVAAFARIQRWMSEIPGLEKLAWTSILPEYDPYKYNSFAVYAGEQIYALTNSLQARLTKVVEAGRMGAFPRLLVFQSVVDATISPFAVVEVLLDRLDGTPAELVLFDTNRLQSTEHFMKLSHAARRDQLIARRDLGFDLTVVSNTSDQSLELMARRRAVGERTWAETPLGMSWPRGVYSLSHVALPFRADDPIYGAGLDPSAPSPIRLGSANARGELGVLGIPAAQLARLRYNPFFPFVKRRLTAALDRID